jgi:hypothetical protein
MTDANLGWQAQIWVIIIPTLVYALPVLGTSFSKTTRCDGVTSIGENLKAMFNPIVHIYLRLHGVYCHQRVRASAMDRVDHE